MDEFFSQFKDKFIIEATELLIKLEGNLLELDKNPGNSTHIEEVFRVMHTLKGVAGMYGFNSIETLTHQLETLYELIRTKKLNLSTDILSITLESVDYIRLLLKGERLKKKEDSKDEEHETPESYLILLYKLEKISIASGINPEAVSTSVETTPKEHNNKPEQTDSVSSYYITLRVETTFAVRGIKLDEIFEELAELGRYQIIKHNLQPADGNEGEPGDTTTGIYFATNKPVDEIEDVFLFVSDCTIIRKIADLDLFSQSDFVDKLDDLKADDSDEVFQNKQDSMIALVEKKYHNNDEILLNQPVSLVNDTVEEIEVTEDTEDAFLAIKNEEYSPKIQSKTVRISVEAEKLDTLMFLVTELVTEQSKLELAIKDENFKNLKEIQLNIKKLTAEFRDNTISMRLIPVSDMLVSFKRLIRDLSLKLGKEIELLTQGMNTELDKSTIDAIRQPLMHILRNAIDHGIELPGEREKNNKSRKGVIKVTAYHSGSFVFINIQDDGKGIDKDYIRQKAIEKGIINSSSILSEKEIYDLIFYPGFSTAEQLTEISGRGVGMDIVKQKINELRGEFEINSEKGLGTSFTIKLKQTIAIIDTMLIKVEEMFFMLPLDEVEVCVQRTKSQLYSNNNRRVEHEDNLVPLVNLREEFDLQESSAKKEQVIIINKQGKKFAVTADKIIGEHQAVLKPLGGVFKTMLFLSGGSILGDGNIALMLDTSKLITV